MWNVNFQMFKLDLEKAEEPKIKLPTSAGIIEKAREFRKNIRFCFIDYNKASDCVDHNKLWKILKEMGIPDHLTCLLRNLYTNQEATVRTRHGTMDWFQIGKGVCQGCILSPCLFNLYAEWKWVKSLSHVWLFAIPWTVAYHAPLSMGFSRQEYWSGLPFPSPICHFLLQYAEYMMWNARVDEPQAGIKIAGRNIITSDMQMTPPLW